MRTVRVCGLRGVPVGDRPAVGLTTYQHAAVDSVGGKIAGSQGTAERRTKRCKAAWAA
jgi:hypothetical protein